jgi:hypothetical protein
MVYLEVMDKPTEAFALTYDEQVKRIGTICMESNMVFKSDDSIKKIIWIGMCHYNEYTNDVIKNNTLHNHYSKILNSMDNLVNHYIYELQENKKEIDRLRLSQCSKHCVHSKPDHNQVFHVDDARDDSSSTEGIDTSQDFTQTDSIHCNAYPIDETEAITVYEEDPIDEEEEITVYEEDPIDEAEEITVDAEDPTTIGCSVVPNTKSLNTNDRTIAHILSLIDEYYALDDSMVNGYSNFTFAASSPFPPRKWLISKGVTRHFLNNKVTMKQLKKLYETNRAGI